jgi:hypothetical protein
MIANGKIDGVSGIRVLDKLTYAGVKENLVQAEKITNYRQLGCLGTAGRICTLGTRLGGMARELGISIR